ncbi:MAG: hypothetical protein D3906_16725, partial [Candidatus Electrothrix sp. AUS1_2]|nr:hypothetical protein [Candidatus Electrothrix sp. AUS1_2]
MTGEQRNPATEITPAFGEILINPDAGTSDTEEKESRPSPRPEKPRWRRRKSRRKEKKEDSAHNMLNCFFILLLVPSLLFLSYMAAARYLLPYYIQEILAARYSRQLNRPVTVTQVNFAPLSLDLRLADIHIGPEFNRREQKEPALCYIAAVDARLRLHELLQRRIVLEDTQIKGMRTELVRRADGSFTNFSGAKY